MQTKIIFINISEILYNDKHPIKICENENYYTLLSSIKENGLLPSEKQAKEIKATADKKSRILCITHGVQLFFYLHINSKLEKGREQ